MKNKLSINTKKILSFLLLIIFFIPFTYLAAKTELPQTIKESNPVQIIANITKYMLGILGVSSIIMFLYGGFMLVFSVGNEEKLKKGRSIIVWAIIGLAIVLSSYSILNYVFTKMVSSTGA